MARRQPSHFKAGRRWERRTTWPTNAAGPRAAWPPATWPPARDACAGPLGAETAFPWLNGESLPQGDVLLANVDGWKVETDGIMAVKTKDGETNRFRSKVGSLARHSQYSRPKIESLLGETCGDIGPGGSDGEESTETPGSGRTSVMASTLLFGVSDIACIDDLGSMCGSPLLSAVPPRSPP